MFGSIFNTFPKLALNRAFKSTVVQNPECFQTRLR
jgi:hypothetical protein